MRIRRPPNIHQQIRTLQPRTKLRYLITGITVEITVLTIILAVFAAHIPDSSGVGAVAIPVSIFGAAFGGAVGVIMYHDARTHRAHHTLDKYLTTHLTADGTAHPDAVNDIATIISTLNRTPHTWSNRTRLNAALTYPQHGGGTTHTGEPDITRTTAVTLLRYRNLGRAHPDALHYQQHLIRNTTPPTSRNQTLTDVAAAIAALPANVADTANALASDIDTIPATQHLQYDEHHITQILTNNLWDDIVGTATALHQHPTTQQT
jgi:hypothetical protein